MFFTKKDKKAIQAGFTTQNDLITGLLEKLGMTNKGMDALYKELNNKYIFLLNKVDKLGEEIYQLTKSVKKPVKRKKQ